jgi:hypothetical protein
MSTIVFHRQMAPRPRRIRSATNEVVLIVTALTIIGAAHAIGFFHIASAYGSQNPVEVPGHMLSAD